ncbi:MAG: 4-(cytidine 5'-diphospho)-2-C-methyl-D-erythritol kinase [Prolixibacteraceae bacterium]|jgi:4-diphosphocytidyl-2-C-methyl-D-erythritol kinase|nr:4-(cytidine 5'-diphospho)-2-C-methyl-D-erythritol kinase [Prolixibacteraceae bacterium]
MIVFPNAKINIGLNILNKRPDNFHNIESLFYPVQLCDILELTEASDFSFSHSGISFESDAENNLVVKAYRMMQERFRLPDVHIHLHKQIPVGAGLGGGSSDAAFMLNLLNDYFRLKLNNTQLREFALTLGSDCPFFIENRPMIAQGRGEILNGCNINLVGWHLLLVKPDVFVSTAEAYAGVKPVVRSEKLSDMLQQPVRTWKMKVLNQFEKHVFELHPDIKAIKDKMYESGAEYASMSGSGSSVFGLFRTKPENIEEMYAGCFVHSEVLR